MSNGKMKHQGYYIRMLDVRNRELKVTKLQQIFKLY